MSNWLNRTLASTMLAAALGVSTAHAQEVKCAPQKPGTAEKIAGQTAGTVTQGVGREATRQAGNEAREALSSMGAFGKAISGTVGKVVNDVGRAATGTATNAAKDSAESTVEAVKGTPDCVEPAASRQTEKPSVAEKAASDVAAGAAREGARQATKLINGLFR